MTTLPQHARKAAIDAKCVDCIYDPKAAGTKFQQTSLCRCCDCPLWPTRPITKSPIPAKVLSYYGVLAGDPCLERIPKSTSTLLSALDETDLVRQYLNLTEGVLS